MTVGNKVYSLDEATLNKSRKKFILPSFLKKDFFSKEKYYAKFDYILSWRHCIPTNNIQANGSQQNEKMKYMQNLSIF